jgi:hypothetical protein
MTNKIITTYSFKGQTNASKEDIFNHINELLVLIGRPKITRPELKLPMDAESAYLYAVNSFKGRCPEVEPIILANVSCSYFYAYFVIGGRFPEAESMIMKDPVFAFDYAKYILKERWIEAEPYIKNDETWWNYYTKHFNLDI